MCYVCQVCESVVPPRTQQKRFVVYRLNGQIEREVPTCDTCLGQLQVAPMASVVRERRRAVASERALRDNEKRLQKNREREVSYRTEPVARVTKEPEPVLEVPLKVMAPTPPPTKVLPPKSGGGRKHPPLFKKGDSKV